MKSKDVILLKKIIEYCNQAEEACEMFGNNYEKFITNSVFTNSCCMCVLQIGELCKLLSDEIRLEENNIPWKQWCGIRDIFAHQYSNLDYQSEWDTIQEDLPVLKNKITDILKG